MLPSGFHLCLIVKITCKHTMHMHTQTCTVHTHIHTPCMHMHDTYTRYTYITDNTHTHVPHTYAYHTRFFLLRKLEIKTPACVLSTLNLGILTRQMSLLGLFLVKPCVQYQNEAVSKTDIVPQYSGSLGVDHKHKSKQQLCSILSVLGCKRRNSQTWLDQKSLPQESLPANPKGGENLAVLSVLAAGAKVREALKQKQHGIAGRWQRT